MSSIVKFGLPGKQLLQIPRGNTPVPPSPFKDVFLTRVYDVSMRVSTPLTIAIFYFSFVHFVNPLIRQRQLSRSGHKDNKEKQTAKELKRLPAAPFAISKSYIFKIFVLFHNLFLCGYSVWTFIGITSSILKTIESLKLKTNSIKGLENFFQSVCDLNNGIFSSTPSYYNLQVFGWWFYISKFYEVIDTIIILLKGRPSSLLQSYHHAGAMMCMWAGIRFQAPPIWIFVVFNSFIHSLMYFYFSLSCIHIKVPNLFKRVLTSMQITQFVVGGSLAVLHAFVWFTDLGTGELINCINTPDQALPLLINVSYLTPLTALFAAFYIESYIKRTTHK